MNLRFGSLARGKFSVITNVASIALFLPTGAMQQCADDVGL